MDIATRFQPRARGQTQSYLEKERNGNALPQEDSGGECMLTRIPSFTSPSPPCYASTAHPHADPSASRAATDSISNHRRAKFPRTATGTTTDPHETADTTNPFRKPSLPASATRQAGQGQGQGGMEHQSSVRNRNRRRSTMRENARVPSGPRQFPGRSGSPGKR